MDSEIKYNQKQLNNEANASQLNLQKFEVKILNDVWTRGQVPSYHAIKSLLKIFEEGLKRRNNKKINLGLCEFSFQNK